MSTAAPTRATRQLFIGTATLVGVATISGASASSLSEPVKAILNAIGASLGGLLVLVDQAIEERRDTKGRRLAQLAEGSISGRPLRLAVGLGLVLICFERLVLIAAGVFVALYLLLVGAQVTLDEVVGMVAFMAYPIAVPIVVTGMVFLSRYVAHRIHTYPLRWIVFGVLIHMVADVVLLALVANALDLPIDVPTVLRTFSVFFILEVVTAAAGSHWAERERVFYLMSRVFKRMTESDQHDLAELALTDPRFRERS